MDEPNNTVPDNCRLVALFDGVGDNTEVGLYVEGPDGETVAQLSWPKNWPERVSRDFVRKAGFEVVIA